jgi:hypothetical protein
MTLPATGRDGSPRMPVYRESQVESNQKFGLPCKHSSMVPAEVQA